MCYKSKVYVECYTEENHFHLSSLANGIFHSLYGVEEKQETIDFLQQMSFCRAVIE